MSSGADPSTRTVWRRSAQTPLRQFLRTETGGAAVLLAATAVALAWANVDASSYEGFWGTIVAIDVGDAGISLDLHHWVNSGLMAFFFFVVGLETRRELDLGELRERRRFLIPVLAGLGGIAAAVGIYLAVNAGHSSAHGWGVAVSTDTAFALGLLAVLGPRFPDRLRAFLLTIVVVDDVVALAVVGIYYSEDVSVPALAAAGGLFALIVGARALGLRRGSVYLLLGAAVWVALVKSGVEAAIVGLAMGLLTFARPAARSDLELATERFLRFREQPTAELARSAGAGLRSALSPNDRLQQLFHPWTSYVIVPVFALANAGIAIDRDFLRDALSSPITLGIVLASVLGKPLGIVGATWINARLGGGRVRAPVGWAALLGGGTIAGIGFTVALLVAELAFEGADLAEAKAGILAAALIAAFTTWLIFRVVALLPERRRLEALLGSADLLTDLAVDVSLEHDHVRGRADARVTVVEYGDFECPQCGRAETTLRELSREFGDVRHVWRHLPLNDVHPRAQLAAEAAEAAAAQGAFWPMHDLLLAHQDALRPSDLLRYAGELGLKLDRFSNDLRTHAGENRIAEDVDSADLSGVSGTPTFFINGRRHYGTYDIATLSAAVRAAGARASLAVPAARDDPGADAID